MSSKKPKDPHNFKEIGEYNVKDPLGEGVNGAVRLGVHKETGIKVALKFIAKLELTDKQEERLRREIRFLTLLNHPNIVKLHDVFETGGYYVLAMDRIRKGELLKYITDNGYLPEAKFRVLFRQMLSAVNYCHENSVVHRDLKPENILMDDNKNIKIIDFGLSNLFDGQNYLTTFCGSPKYAAPEIITGTKYIGPSVDIWSLGVILFAALTGKLPFNGKTVESTYSKVLAGVVKYPPHLSPSVQDYLARFLVLDPVQRITMAEAMEHPWIQEGFGTPVETHLPPRSKTVSDPQPDVFSQLLEYGYTEKEARLSLMSANPNPIRNTYFLLLEKKAREQKAISESASRERFSFSNLLNHSLKSRKNKFDKDGFLLDVTYITSQILRMSHPGETVGSLFMNPMKEVQRFLDRYHRDHFKIYNLTPDSFSSYSPEKFNNAVVRYNIPDETVPAIETLYTISQDMDDYLGKSPENMAVVHGKQDIIRPAVVICAYLLHSHVYDTVNEVISYFTDKMYPVEDKVVKNLFTASAKRYLHYYLSFRDFNFTLAKERLLCISTIELNAIPQFDVYGGCDPFVKVKMGGPKMVNVKKTDPIRHFSSKKDTSIKINCDTVPMSGDIQVSVLDRDPLYAETMFSISLHLSFLEEFHTIIPGEPETEVEESDQDEFVVITPTESRLGAISSRFSVVFTKSELDIDKKFLDRFPEDFAVTITFTEPRVVKDAEGMTFVSRRMSALSVAST